MDYDAIVIGGGAAGLTAATALARAKRHILVLDRESFGGQAMNLEWVEDYPAPGERMEGPAFGSKLVEAAEAAGVELELGEVIEVEAYSGCVSVTSAEGKAYTASVAILATGLRNKPLDVPGEAEFEGRGMIHCAFCDAGLYRDRVVAVCGGGDAGAIEALLLAKHASRVHLIESGPALTASAALQERVRAEPRLEVRCGERVTEVIGDDGVKAIAVQSTTGSTERLDVYGVLVHTGFEPSSEYAASAVELDEGGYVSVNAELATSQPAILAAGDVRSGSKRRVADAMKDGQLVAAKALALLS
jgi:thioredoxin reductase (NADPH)